MFLRTLKTLPSCLMLLYNSIILCMLYNYYLILWAIDYYISQQPMFHGKGYFFEVLKLTELGVMTTRSPSRCGFMPAKLLAEYQAWVYTGVQVERNSLMQYCS